MYCYRVKFLTIHINKPQRLSVYSRDSLAAQLHSLCSTDCLSQLHVEEEETAAQILVSELRRTLLHVTRFCMCYGLTVLATVIQRPPDTIQRPL